jgi:Zn-dependent protease
MEPSVTWMGLLWYAVFLASTTVHEAAHALAARLGGDPTAYHAGQLSLDPRPHLRREPFGMLVLPLLTALASGWPIGFASAPFDPHWAARHPRRAAWMALAGPAANGALVLVAVGAIWLGIALGVFGAPERVSALRVTEAVAAGPWPALALLASAFFTLNLLLATFNLLPLPPLDGSGALPLVLPERVVSAFQALMRQPVVAIGGVLLAWQVFGVLFAPIFRAALSLVYPGTGFD